MNKDEGSRSDEEEAVEVEAQDTDPGIHSEGGLDEEHDGQGDVDQDAKESERQQVPLQEIIASFKYLIGLIRKIPQIRVKIHHVFGPDHIEKGELSWALRSLCGALGAVLICIVPVLYYAVTDIETIKAFFKHELLTMPIYPLAFFVAVVVGVAVAISNPTGTVWGHIWRSAIDIVLFFIFCVIGIRYLGI